MYYKKSTDSGPQTPQLDTTTQCFGAQVLPDMQLPYYYSPYSYTIRVSDYVSDMFDMASRPGLCGIVGAGPRFFRRPR